MSQAARLLLLLFISTSLCTAQTAPMQEEFAIGAADLLDINVLGVPDFSRQVRVTGSGFINMPFLGKIRACNSMVYKSDIRGDELKHQGDVFHYQEFDIPLTRDEGIYIQDSLLVKTLVHHYSHDPESLEEFFIKDTAAAHYANIHGSPSEGCFLGPFATVDLTTIRDCVVGTFSYVQAGEIGHLNVAPGTVWVRDPDAFNFLYRYPPDQ